MKSGRNSSGTFSSKLTLFPQTFCISTFMVKITGAKNPSGSNTESTTLRNCFLVGRHSSSIFLLILKMNESLSRSHSNPSVRSMSSFSNSRSELGFARPNSFSSNNTVFEFEVHFVKLNPPLAKRAFSSCDTRIASSSVGKDSQ